MNYLKIILDMPNQVRDGVKLAKGVKVKDEINKIVFAGMGGSGVPGDLLHTYLKAKKIPSFVNKDYSLPDWVDSKTLVFVNSYSGETEETLAMCKEAIRKNAKIIAITTGGRLRELAKTNEKEVIAIPKGMPPRAAIAYFFFPMLIILHNSKLIKISSADIVQVIDALRKPAIKLKSMDLADQLQKKIPIIYCSERLRGVGLRWKQEFNEDAKIHAFFNTYPEMNHNELEAYETRGPYNFHIILLKDEKDNIQVRKRIDMTKDIFKSKGYPVTEIMLRGDSLLVKMFTAIAMGDLASLYLAEKYGREPMQTELIDNLKKKLMKK